MWHTHTHTHIYPEAIISRKEMGCMWVFIAIGHTPCGAGLLFGHQTRPYIWQKQNMITNAPSPPWSMVEAASACGDAPQLQACDFSYYIILRTHCFWLQNCSDSQHKKSTSVFLLTLICNIINIFVLTICTLEQLKTFHFLTFTFIVLFFKGHG